jgi:hypothetical protein
MKIKVTLEFDIDPDTWKIEYGNEFDAEEQAYVREFLPELVHGHVQSLPIVQNGIVDLVKR